MNVRYQLLYSIFEQDIKEGLYDKSCVAFLVQFGIILGYLELSDFTEVERNKEENRLRGLFDCWKKRYYLKEE